MKNTLRFQVLIATSLISLFSTKTFGQISVTDVHVNSVKTQIQADITALDTGTKAPLVTYRTFRKIFVKQYNKVLTGDNGSGSSARYASLKVDQDKSSVTFAPINFIFPDPTNHPFHFMGNISIKGEVNSNQVFTLFNSDGFAKNYEVALNINYLPFLGGINKFSYPKITEFRARQTKVLTEVADEYTTLVNGSGTSILKSISNKKRLRSVKELEKNMRKSFSEYEEQLAEPYWTKRNKFWVGVSAAAGSKSQDVFDVQKKIINQLNFTSGSINVSFNFLQEFLKPNISILANASIEGNTKNSFTGKSTKAWNLISNDQDTSFIVSDKKNVYMYDSATYRKEFLPTCKGGLIVMWDNDKLPIGIDVNYKYEWLVTAPSTSQINKMIENYGVIFPFNNKDGERAINIEIFYSHTRYTSTILKDEEYWGVKFAIPVFSH